MFFRLSLKSDYKLKRETIKLFELANEAYGMQMQRRSVRSLRVAFALLGDESVVIIFYKLQNTFLPFSSQMWF